MLLPWTANIAWCIEIQWTISTLSSGLRNSPTESLEAQTPQPCNACNDCGQQMQLPSKFQPHILKVGGVIYFRCQLLPYCGTGAENKRSCIPKAGLSAQSCPGCNRMFGKHVSFSVENHCPGVSSSTWEGGDNRWALPWALWEAQAQPDTLCCCWQPWHETRLAVLFREDLTSAAFCWHHTV